MNPFTCFCGDGLKSGSRNPWGIKALKQAIEEARWKSQLSVGRKGKPWDLWYIETVDGRNPASPWMVETLQIMG